MKLRRIFKSPSIYDLDSKARHLSGKVRTTIFNLPLEAAPGRGTSFDLPQESQVQAAPPYHHSSSIDHDQKKVVLRAPSYAHLSVQPSAVRGLGEKRASYETPTARVITTGSGLLVRSVGSILTEVILQREGLCIENLGWIMQMLTHEINNDLQGALNTMVTFSISNTNLAVDQLTKFRVMLTRASHGIRLMSEVPFLVGNVLPVERDIVSLSDTLRGPIDGIRQAWPDISFVLEFPENAKGLERIVDQHIVLILRNLLHNITSFSAEEGTIRISV